MAIAPVLNCRFPQDLLAAAAAMDQEIGDRFANSLALLEAAETAGAGVGAALEQASQQLSIILANGDGSATLTNCADVSEQFGLQQDPDTLTTEQAETADETFMFYSGAGLFDNIVYVLNQSGNIENLRRLYFASGRDLNKTSDFLKSTHTLIIHNKSEIKTVLPKAPKYSAYSLEEVKTLLDMPYLTERDTVINEDFTTSVFVRGQFLAADQSLSQTKKQYGLKTSEISTSVFHFGAVDNTSAGISKYTRYGYNDSKLNAILAGVDLALGFPEFLDGKIKGNRATATAIISKLDFIISRLSNLPNLATATDKVKASILNLRALHLGLLSDIKFQVSVIADTSVLDSLRAKHADAAIIRLLEQRPEVTGFQFGSTDSDLNKMLTTSYAASPGSTLISNRFLARGLTEVHNIKTLMEMDADIYRSHFYLSNALNPTRADNFIKSREALIAFGAKEPKLKSTSYVHPDGSLGSEKSSGQFYQGQPSVGTPSSILAERLDAGKTLGPRADFVYQALFLPDLTDLFGGTELAKAVISVIDTITKLFESAMRSVDLLFAKARNFLMPLKRKLDAFMSQFLSLTGSGSFDTSLLKCAINFDFGISITALDQLLAFMDSLAALAGAFLSALITWVSDIIQNVLCLPINMINAYVGGISQALPAGCQVPSFNFGLGISTSLLNLKAVADMKQRNMQAFGGDLVRYRAIVSGAPDKLSQFKQGGLCSSGGNINKLYSASMLNISGGLLRVGT